MFDEHEDRIQYLNGWAEGARAAYGYCIWLAVLGGTLISAVSVLLFF